jgi:hypothetical protein
MPCFTPLTAYQNTDKAMPQQLVFPKKNSHPSNLSIKQRYSDPAATKLEDHGYKRMEIPCGKCMSCRLDYSMKWAGRLIAEAKLYGDQNCFLTLTYDPKHYPDHGFLQKPDLQKFLKRLRTHHSGVFPVEGVESKNGRHPIRFYACGEYGGDTGRAHYHLAILNWKPSDLMPHGGKTEHGDQLYTSNTLSKLWGLGHVLVGELTAESASYVSRYVTKKIGGEAALDHYSYIDPETGELLERPKEFATMSLKPGIGLPFLKKHTGDLLHGQLIMRKKNKILKLAIPKYFEKKLAEIHPEHMEEFKSQKEALIKKRMRDNPEEFSPKRMAVKAKCFELKTKVVHKRNPNV